MKLLSCLLYYFTIFFYRKEKRLFLFKLGKELETFKKRKYKIDTRYVLDVLILAEDHRYYFHCGVDFIATLRAIIKNIFFGRSEGGSTIEQQLVRTITGDYGRNMKRKFKEMVLATLVDRLLDKDIIPEFYLHLAYFGHGMFGIVKVCERLSIDMCEISVADSARIVARLKYPESMRDNSQRQRRINWRVKHILRLFYKNDLKLLSKEPLWSHLP